MLLKLNRVLHLIQNYTNINLSKGDRKTGENARRCLIYTYIFFTYFSVA